MDAPVNIFDLSMFSKNIDCFEVLSNKGKSWFIYDEIVKHIGMRCTDSKWGVAEWFSQPLDEATWRIFIQEHPFLFVEGWQFLDRKRD